MGWTFIKRRGMTPAQAQEALIIDLTAPEQFKTLDGTHYDRKCLAHELGKSNALWTVWHVKKTKNGVTTEEKYIGCDLIENGGYKDMCEVMGPYYYDCPMKFLDMAPVANQAWRDKVLLFHLDAPVKKPVHVRGRKEVALVGR